MSTALIDVTRPIAEQAGLLRRQWASRGRTLSLSDLLIAASAIHHGMVLVTDNVRDFQTRDLRLGRPES